MTLVDFEWQLLEAMAGQRPALEWGGAVGAALECLTGSGYVEAVWEPGFSWETPGEKPVARKTYRVTQRGLDALAARKQG